MTPDDPILKRCKTLLASLYGERLKGLILYGSMAQGTERDDSDIDLLVLLDGAVDAGLEIRRMWESLYPVQLDSDRIISLMPADAEDYRRGAYMLYRNVRDHGVLV